jgi:hypothetical protein
MNSTEITEETKFLDESLVEYIPTTEKDLPILTMAEIAINKLSNFEMAYIGWLENDKHMKAYVVPVSSSVKSFNKRTNKFKVKSFFDERELIISASDITQVTACTREEEFAEYFYNHAERIKQAYLTVVDIYKCFNLADLYLLTTKEEKLALFYGCTVEELQDLDKCKNFVMTGIIKLLDREIANVAKEFQSATSTIESIDNEPNEELNQITEFLNSVKNDFSIFSEAKNSEEILACCPVIVSPSPAIDFLTYINGPYSRC